MKELTLFESAICACVKGRYKPGPETLCSAKGHQSLEADGAVAFVIRCLDGDLGFVQIWSVLQATHFRVTLCVDSAAVVALVGHGTQVYVLGCALCGQVFSRPLAKQDKEE